MTTYMVYLRQLNSFKGTYLVKFTMIDGIFTIGGIQFCQLIKNSQNYFKKHKM